MINKLTDLKKSWRSDKPPIAIIDKKENTVNLNYGKEGEVKIYFKDVEQRPKTIFDAYFLFLYLTRKERPFNSSEADLKRLNVYLKNIIKAEKGRLEQVYVYEDLKGGIN